jgi:hypothetical protein
VTGDLSFAKEPAQAAIDTLPEAPKATEETAEDTTLAEAMNEPGSGAAPEDRQGDLPRSVVALAGRSREVAETAMRSGSDQVTVRAKPEKRKNYKERAKAKFAKDDSEDNTKDGTTPDTTATAKSEVMEKAKEKAKVEKKAKAKVERQKAKESRKAQKADGKTGTKAGKAGRKAA